MTRRVGPAADRRQRGPGEVDPLVGPSPHVVAPHDRLWLLVDDRRPHRGHVAGAELAYQFQRPAGVGDVVGDQHLGAGEVYPVQRGRQDGGKVEPLIDPRVELDVHHEEVLHVEGVAEGAAEEEAAAGDRQDRVGFEPVFGHLPGELAARRPERLVGQRLALGRHGRRWSQACTAAWSPPPTGGRLASWRSDPLGVRSAGACCPPCGSGSACRRWWRSPGGWPPAGWTRATRTRRASAGWRPWAGWNSGRPARRSPASGSTW